MKDTKRSNETLEKRDGVCPATTNQRGKERRTLGNSWGKEARVSGATGGALSHTRKNSPLQLEQRPSASTDQFPHHQHRTQRERQVRLGLQKLLEDTRAPATTIPPSTSNPFPSFEPWLLLFPLRDPLLSEYTTGHSSMKKIHDGPVDYR